MRLPTPVAHVPVAPGGFDASKPYEPKAVATEGNTVKPEAPPKRPLRPVAALLGGLGKKS